MNKQRLATLACWAALALWAVFAWGWAARVGGMMGGGWAL